MLFGCQNVWQEIKQSHTRKKLITVKGNGASEYNTNLRSMLCIKYKGHLQVLDKGILQSSSDKGILQNTPNIIPTSIYQSREVFFSTSPPRLGHTTPGIFHALMHSPGVGSGYTNVRRCVCGGGGGGESTCVLLISVKETC